MVRTTRILDDVSLRSRLDLVKFRRTVFDSAAAIGGPTESSGARPANATIHVDQHDVVGVDTVTG